jgi:uncharacterized protein (TIGR03435 family)
MRDPYDVTAVAGREIEWEELAPLMRNALTERFKLVARIEKRVRPVYALTRANPDGRLGPNLRQTTDCDARKGAAECRQGFGPGRMESTGFSMEGLALNLAYAAGRTVIDRTGLKGDYAFTLEYAVAPRGGSVENAGDGPSVFTALQEQLGSTLQAEMAPLSVVVLDRIERPTPDWRSAVQIETTRHSASVVDAASPGARLPCPQHYELGER